MTRFWRLLNYAKKYKGLIALSIFCNVLTALFTVVSAPAIIPFLQILFGVEQPILQEPEFTWTLDGIKEYTNYQLSAMIQADGKEGALIYVCIGIILVFFFKNLFRYLAAFFMSPVRNGMVRDIRQQLFEKITNLDLGWFSERRKGDLLARMTIDVQEVEISIFNVLVTVFREPLVIIGSLIFLLYVSPQLTLFVFGLMLFTGIIIGGIGKTLKKKSSKVQERLGDLVAMLEENLSGLRILKSFNAQHSQAAKFQKENDDYSYLLTRLLWRRDLSSPLSEFLGVTMVAILLWYGSALVFSGELAAETFLAFLFAFFNVSQPTKAFSNAFYNIQKGMAAVDRIDDILSIEPTINEIAEPQQVITFSRAIDFQNVNFAYANETRKAVDNINLSIPKGKVIAVVGSSGSGKTTLIDLLLRFYDNDSGEILIDGVSQEPILFNDTIFNNIIFGLPNCAQTDVEKAAKIANAHDFIIATENGYQTNIGDRGNKLSGVLDEATSALDSASEKLVQNALEKIMQNRTTIIIAHRLSTIQHADEIVVLKDGQVVESGNHQSLLEQNGEYRKFVQFQVVGDEVKR